MRLALHLLANLDIDLEELCYAAVKADGLALVQIGFAVRRVDAFCRAGFEEAVKRVLVTVSKKTSLGGAGWEVGGMFGRA